MGKNVSPQMRVAHDNESRYIQFLLKVADSSLSQNAKAAELGKKFFARNDIAVINMGRGKVERDAPKLVKILLLLPEDDAQRAMLLLQGALSGAFEIGTRCAHKVRGEANSEIMRNRRKPGDETRIAALDAATLACVNHDRSLLNSYRCKMVPRHEEVIKELPKHINTERLKVWWPGITTLVTRISSLKRERA